MNSRSLLTVAIFGLLLNLAVAEDEEGGAASSGKNEARLLVGKHVRENFWIKKLLFFNTKTVVGTQKFRNKLLNWHKGKNSVIMDISYTLWNCNKVYNFLETQV